MTRKILVILLLFAANFSLAQKDRTTEIWGHIRDSFTQASIRDVKVTLMTADSTIVDTTTVYDLSKGQGIFDATYKFTVPAIAKHFIIKASHPDYDDCFVDFNMKYVKRNASFDAKWHQMKRRIKRISSMDSELDELVVTASKVRFAYHGDTLVYYADAFNVPEGSMLDGLLKQMNGVEVDKDGNITVNGRHVDYLTLNGKDFFKGKNQMMLQNLPYYTVQKVEFYDKSSERSEVVGFDIDKRDFVGNVQLKREYNIGYMGNIEAGGGLASQENMDGHTDIELDRFLARAFGLRFTGNTRLSLMGGTNNVGKAGAADGNGNWNDYNDTRRRTLRNIGANLMLNGKGGELTNETSVFMNGSRCNSQQRTSTENYLQNGKSYGIENTSDVSSYQTIALDNTFKISHTKGALPYYFNSNISISRSVSDGSNDISSMMFGTNPFDEDISLSDTIHSKDSKATNHSKTFSLYARGQGTVKLPWGDHLDFMLWKDYNKEKRYDYLLNRYRFWKDADKNIHENRYDEKPNTLNRTCAMISYSFNWLNGWRLELYSSYRYDKETTNSDYYRLDRLGGIYSNMTSETWREMLPSNRDSLLLCRNRETSYDLEYSQGWNQNYLQWAYTRNQDGNYTYFEFRLYGDFYTRHIDYQSDTQDYQVRLRDHVFCPAIQYEIGRNNMQKHFYISARVNQYLPDVMNIIDVTDRTDTLAVRKGNPNLKKNTVYTLSTYYQTRGKHDFNSRIALDANVTQNAVAQGFVQDATTGCRTYKPENVNGNWKAGISYYVGSAIDAGKHLHWTLNTSYNYTHSVDLSGTSDGSQSQLSTVLSHRLSVGPELKYDFKKLTLQLGGKVDWNNYRQKDDSSFGTQNIFNIKYGGQAIYSFPFKLQVSTDLNMYSNKGFADSRMNIDRLLWNAQLTYPFCKGKLLAKLICSDILGQRTNVDYVVNAQGRVETWKNSIGRYLIGTLQWKF